MVAIETGNADTVETNKTTSQSRWTAEPAATTIRRRHHRNKASTSPAFALLKKSKSVTFSTDQEGEITVHVCEYVEHDNVETSQVYSQDTELRESRRECHKTVQATYRNDPNYHTNVIRLFRSRGFHHSEGDLQMLSTSPCRGLERKLSPVFGTHRRWAIDGVMKMQETDNNQECMRFFSKRASQPCVNFARLLATADRKAADEIYSEDDVCSSQHSSCGSSYFGNYWSDSSRSLASADSLDSM